MSSSDRDAPTVAGSATVLVGCVSSCVAMLFVLDTLYRLDSMLKAMAPYDVLVSTVTAFLIVLVAGGLLVLAGLGAVLLVGPLRSNLLTLVMWLALVFLVLIFCRGLLEWLHQVSGADARVLETWVYSLLGIRISPGVWRSFFYVSVVAVVCVYLLKAERLHAAFAAIEGMGKALARAALFMAVAAVAFVGYHMVSGRSGRSSPVCATRFQTSGGTWRDAATRDPQPDIVLVTFDALTARDMSLYGYRLLTTPGLERLSGESNVYESAISVANWTKPSTVSILTGQYPHHHGLVSTFRDAVALGNSDRTLPALLREMGYRTSAVVSNLTYGHPFGNGTYRSFDACPWDTYSPGFLDGNLFRRLRHRVRDQVSAALIDFDIYVSGWMDELLNYPGEFLNHLGASRFGQWGGVWNRASPAPAATTFARARQVLEQRTGQPQFVWVHVFPPHAPYLPESAYRGRFLPAEEFATAPSQARLVGAYAEGLQDDVDRLRLRYNEVILEADEAFADFVDFLKESGRWENTLLVVSSDHGDSFEDGMQGHKGEFLYQQLIHIPLLIHLPGQREGARIDGAVSQVDIAPTILDYLGGTVPSWMDGEALGRDLTRAGEKSYRYAMEIEANGPRQPITRGIVAVTDGRYKLVYSLTHDSVELFDLLADPDESRNIAPENGELVERMQTALIDRISNE